MMCGKCSKACAWGTLLLGIIFILNSVNGWFSYSEWGIVLILWGLCRLLCSNCPDCQALMKGRK